MSDVLKDILPERHSKHGEFEDNAGMTWDAMEVWEKSPNWNSLPSGKRHAIYMITHKIARALAGDHNEPDHWDDIGGYAKCVADRIREPVAREQPDIYLAVAQLLNVSRPVAKSKLLGMMYHRSSGAHRQAQFNTPVKPGTPEDGGQHGLMPVNNENVDRVLNQLERELTEEAEEIPAVGGWLSPEAQEAFKRKQD